MSEETRPINLSSMKFFKKKYPEIEVKMPRWATKDPVDQYRSFEVGDIYLFPIDKYNYNVLRSLPTATTGLLKETMEKGIRWGTRVDRENKSIAVIRYA